MKGPQGWDARIQLTVDQDAKHALELARLADRIPLTVRVRAMISLWQTDPDLCDRVDELARELAGKDAK